MRLGGGGEERDEGVENHLPADVVRCGRAKDREDLMVRDLAPQAVDQLFLREAALLEEALHQRIVALGDFLDQFLAGIVRLGLAVVGDVDRLVLSGAVGRVLVCLHRHEIDHAREVFLLAERELDGHDLLAEFLLQGLEGARERGPVAVHFVDDDEAWQLEILGELPHLLGRDLDAGDAADDDGRGVCHAHGPLRFHQENAEAGGVQEVDFVVLPLHVGDRGGDRMLALDLVGVEVRRRRPILDAAEARGRAGVEKELRDERRFAGVVVPGHGHVPNLGTGVNLHMDDLT